ncbi:hypothetical protein J6590_029651 [Homalodisca vitripennis]|nr:hypothetical protein J6590_029651 [Homalodisca vitripennis]
MGEAVRLGLRMGEAVTSTVRNTVAYGFIFPSIERGQSVGEAGTADGRSGNAHQHTQPPKTKRWKAIDCTQHGSLWVSQSSLSIERGECR